MPIGIVQKPSSAERLAVEAHKASARLPDLLTNARQIANTVSLGKHGRRKKGTGEDFWQFRPYVAGEEISSIDWRRSARDEHTYIRDREWELAQTISLWPDRSPSMEFKSKYAKRSKVDQALLLTLTLADLFSRNGERITVPGLMAPIVDKNGAEIVATALMHDKNKQQETIPAPEDLGSFSQLFIMSDYLDAPENIFAKLGPLVQKNIKVHMIEIADPAEETFPYTGRVEFIDPISLAVYTAGRAENLKAEYNHLYFARREALNQEATRRGWTFTTSKTDEPLTKTVLHLANLLNQTHQAGEYSL